MRASSFLAGAAEREPMRLRQLKALGAAAGSWKLEGSRPSRTEARISQVGAASAARERAQISRTDQIIMASYLVDTSIIRREASHANRLLEHIADATIAAVALYNQIPLITDDLKCVARLLVKS